MYGEGMKRTYNLGACGDLIIIISTGLDAVHMYCENYSDFELDIP